jgi:hypothetical protein
VRAAAILLITLGACGTRTGVEIAAPSGRDGGIRDAGSVRPDAGSRDAGSRDGGSRDAGSSCVCAEPPLPECASPSTVRRYGEPIGCDGDRCIYASADEPCPSGQRCEGGACRGRCDCAAGEVCCNPLTCATFGTPNRICVPDPAPCFEPVTAVGCDGRVYGTACGATEAEICPNTCDVVSSRALDVACFPSTARSVTILRDRAAFDAFWGECPIPPAPDFASRDVVVACYDCGCAGDAEIDRVRDCGTHAVVDYHYPELCTECDACRVVCAARETAKLPESFLFTFRIQDCGGTCCGP